MHAKVGPMDKDYTYEDWAREFLPYKCATCGAELEEVGTYYPDIDYEDIEWWCPNKCKNIGRE